MFNYLQYKKLKVIRQILSSYKLILFIIDR